MSDFIKFAPLMTDYQIHEWSNGLRLVYKQVPTTRIVHCGLILDIGSRDEAETQQGIAHFWEHMAFRGTKKRKAKRDFTDPEDLRNNYRRYRETRLLDRKLLITRAFQK